MENKKLEVSVPDFIPETLRNDYKKLATRLIELELITEEIDFLEFNMMFFQYFLAIEAMKAIQEKGTFSKDRNILRKNPGVQIFRDSSAALLKYSNKFGLCPQDRENLITSLINSKIYQIQQLRSLKYAKKKKH